MKICFIIGSMKFSGAEKVLSIIAKGLLKKGNEVSVILLEQDYSIISNEDGIVTYGAKAQGNKFKRLFNRWSCIRKNIKKINPNVVISFGSVCNVNMLASLFFIKIPKIICERNDPNFDPRKKNEKFNRWLLYRFANGYIFQTEVIKNYFSKKIQSKSSVIPNPIIDCDIKWDLAQCNQSIATVARLDNFQKDHITMFNAFKEFSKEYPLYKLNVYGDGPDKESYIEYIKKNNMENKIILHGKVSEPLKNIVKSEVFLLTSKYEGMPNALMEAMSIGMPCISTDCGGGGAKALFDMTNFGILVSVGDVDAIVLALKKLINNISLKKKFSKQALEINRILKKERICEKWEIYLKKII